MLFQQSAFLLQVQLSTNMRIPNTAEFLALFVTTGQLTGFSNQRKPDIILFYDQYAADTRRFLFHTASADLDSEALAPACNRPPFRIMRGDTCDLIAKIADAPMLVSL